jgi:hypothetical protein
MNKQRFTHGTLALTMLIPTACGGTTVGEEAPARGSTGSTSDGGVATMEAGGSTVTHSAEAGNIQVDASSSAGVLVDDGTLRVTVNVDAQVDPGESLDAVYTVFGLSAVYRDSGKPVLSAEVTGGPVGHPFALAEGPVTLLGTVTGPGQYSFSGHGDATVPGEYAGYARTWVFSIAREGKVLWMAVLVGPSLPSVTFTPAAASATVAWSPAHEANVRTGVCVAEQVATKPYSPQQSPSWCVGLGPDLGQDEGSVVLADTDQTSGAPETFPRSGAKYVVAVGSIADQSFGMAGAGSVDVNVGVYASVIQ